ncbi:hypothetical protein GCM10020331_052620 [Ectobacillus funiculus]
MNFFGGLMEYNWPGNIRELFNVLERVYIMASDRTEDPTLALVHLLGTQTKSTSASNLEQGRASTETSLTFREKNPERFNG